MRFVWLVFCLLVVSSEARAAQGEIVKRPAGTVSGMPFGYWEYLPLGYDDNPTQKYPLVIFLHGLGGGNGSSAALDGVLGNTAPPRLAFNGRDFPFIMVAPQHYNGWWLNPQVDQILERAKTLYRVDTTRIYLTGLSSGGSATWTYAIAYPQKVAAVVPIAGSDGFANVCPMASVPVWAFHGTADKTVFPENSMRPVNNLNNTCNPRANPAAKLTLYEGVGHDSWGRTYDGSAGHDIYTWLLSFTKGSQPPPATTYALTVNAGSGDGSYAQGAVVTVTADAAPSGYVFSKWTGDVSFITNTTLTQTTFIMPARAASLTATYVALPDEDPDLDIVYAVNAGGPAYTSSDGVDFMADAYFTGGYGAATTETIAGTDAALCQKYRYGEFSYSLPVANGSYDVVLRFNETGNMAGGRIQDVLIEGAVVLDDLDIYRAAGGRMKVYTATVPAQVTDGKLDIRLVKGTGNPMLCAFEVIAAD